MQTVSPKKWDKLKQFIVENDIQIMATGETKITNKINLRMQNYIIYRNDQNSHGGRVLQKP